jgi:hypothetical protein
MHSKQQQNHGICHPSGGPRARVVAIAPAPPASPLPIVQLPTSKRTYASPEDWEAHRDAITRLYYYEEMTLKEVKKYMETHHSFFAT